VRSGGLYGDFSGQQIIEDIKGKKQGGTSSLDRPKNQGRGEIKGKGRKGDNLAQREKIFFESR